MASCYQKVCTTDHAESLYCPSLVMKGTTLAGLKGAVTSQVRSRHRSKVTKRGVREIWTCCTCPCGACEECDLCFAKELYFW